MCLWEFSSLSFKLIASWTFYRTSLLVGDLSDCRCDCVELIVLAAIALLSDLDEIYLLVTACLKETGRF